MERCIVIFPDFDNIEILNDIRRKYDPLYSFIKPHITLVFPFESELPAEEIEAHIRSAVINTAPFELVMKGITVNPDPVENYIFLNVIKGMQEIRGLSKALYTGILGKYKSELYNTYLPHITIGRVGKNADCERIKGDIGHGETEFAALVERVSVEALDGNKSFTEMTISL